MRRFIPEFVICCIIISTVVIIQTVIFVCRIALNGENSVHSLAKLAEAHSPEYAWLIKLSLNCIGYLAVIFPFWTIYQYAKRSNYIETDDPGFLSSLIQRSYCESASLNITSEVVDPQKEDNEEKRDTCENGLLLTYCFIGLAGSFLTWGIFQEKIMKEEYTSIEQGQEIKTHFKESQFLICVSRIIAFVLAGLHLLIHKRPPTEMTAQPALYKYSISSIANIFSSWFQYEALKFISFPTQVLAKSCKIIPVMIMGKLVTRKQYHISEYIVAGLISIGMIIFMMESEDSSKKSAITTLTGVFFLVVYLASDSFNSTWQGDLFKTYRMTTTEMMFYVNLFSGLFTASSLLVQSGFHDSIEFATRHPEFIYDCLLMSTCAAIGQLFIFYTISKFGALVFTIIMTVRQAVAIILSCVIYHHEISHLATFGISLVFFAIVLRIYFSQMRRRLNVQVTLENVILDEKAHPVKERI